MQDYYYFLVTSDKRTRISQEEIFHDVGVVLTAAVRKVAGSEHDDGIQALTIVT